MPDPDGLLDGTGKFMRHVKLIPRATEHTDAAALGALIDTAYRDIKEKLEKTDGRQ